MSISMPEQLHQILLKSLSYQIFLQFLFLFCLLMMLSNFEFFIHFFTLLQRLILISSLLHQPFFSHF